MNKMLLYLFCTMLEDNKSISDKDKFDRLQYLADSINSSISVPPENPKESEVPQITKGGFGFASKGCEILDDKATCTVAVSNLSKEEMRIAIINQPYLGHFASLIGANGDQRTAQKLRFGALSTGSSGERIMEQAIPSGFTINAHFLFDKSSEKLFPAALKLDLQNLMDQQYFSVTIQEVQISH